MCIYCDVMAVIEENLRHAEVDEVCLVRLKGTGMTEDDVVNVLSILSLRGLETQYSFFIEDSFVIIHRAEDEPSTVCH